MRPFDYQRAEGLDHAGQLAARDDAAFIAGGTNLLDLMKLEVETPHRLVDLGDLPLREIADHRDGLAIGALASNTAVAVWTCNGFVPVTYLIMPPWLRTRAG